MISSVTGTAAVGEFSLDSGQGLPQVVALLSALVLCSLIGLERQIRQKAAGLRTHALVGIGAALFMLISKYGFSDLMGQQGFRLDPSRLAAQIVSGIGFIGGGLIFVRRDDIRGLTSAATVWVAAAVGTACGASLQVLASATTVAYFVVALGYPPLTRRLPRAAEAQTTLRLTYRDGAGALRAALQESTARGFRVAGLEVVRERTSQETDPEARGVVVVLLDLAGGGSAVELVTSLAEVPGVIAAAVDTGHDPELD